MSLFTNAIQRGNRASQPAANTVIVGSLYFVTDENITERSNGSAWQSYSGPAAVAAQFAVQTIIREESIIEEAVCIPSSGGTSGSSGKLIQVVNTQTGAVATGTTTIPLDDTIPQNTEGTEFMQVTITPTSSTNKLRIDVVVNLAASAAAAWVIAALFQDSVANALIANLAFNDTGTASVPISFTHYMTAGTTSATTFKVRAGMSSAGTTTFNGGAGGRRLGGVYISSITVSEIAP